MTIPHRHPTSLRILPVYVLFGSALAAFMAASMPGLAQGQGAPSLDTVRVMADAVLIDARCRDVPVDFGALIRFGEERGVTALSIMPLGEKRRDFETAFADRAQSVSVETLCTSIAAEERVLAPEVIRRP